MYEAWNGPDIFSMLLSHFNAMGARQLLSAKYRIVLPDGWMQCA